MGTLGAGEHCKSACVLLHQFNLFFCSCVAVHDAVTMLRVLQRIVAVVIIRCSSTGNRSDRNCEEGCLASHLGFAASQSLTSQTFTRPNLTQTLTNMSDEHEQAPAEETVPSDAEPAAKSAKKKASKPKAPKADKPKKEKKAAGEKKPRAAPKHAPFKVLIVEAIAGLKERTGSSLPGTFRHTALGVLCQHTDAHTQAGLAGKHTMSARLYTAGFQRSTGQLTLAHGAGREALYLQCGTDRLVRYDSMHSLSTADVGEGQPAGAEGWASGALRIQVDLCCSLQAPSAQR